LRAKRKNEDTQFSIELKRDKMADLYTEKRPYAAKPSITSGAQSRLPVPGLGLLLGMRAGETDGGRKPPASSQSPPAPNTREATGPNS